MWRYISYVVFIMLAISALLYPGVVLPECNHCCQSMGGIHHCDSSAGRYICQNGHFSACYCNRHAVMKMEAFVGCCMWKGGVKKVDPKTGRVLCNDGGTSNICNIYNKTSGDYNRVWGDN